MRRGGVLIGTEEDFTEPCDASGRVVLSDISDSVGGEPAANSTPGSPYRMKTLDTFHPAQDGGEAIDPSLGCSAHYFELNGSTLGVAWYGQGLRLLDVSDVRQIGYYRVTGSVEEESSNFWDLAWNGRYVYLFDKRIPTRRCRRAASAAAP